jgi:hypothetical protein
LGEELLKPTKLVLGFPQIIQLLVILAGHGSGQGHEKLFHATTRWLAFCDNVLEEKEKEKPQDDVFHSNILEGSVDLLTYLNDILIGLRHLSTANITVESDDDNEERIRQSTLVPLPFVQDDRTSGHLSDLWQCLLTKITRSPIPSSASSSAIVARKKMEDVKHSSNEQRRRRTRRR